MTFFFNNRENENGRYREMSLKKKDYICFVIQLKKDFISF